MQMGYFHCRPIDPAEDFILTSPASIDDLGEYRTFTKKIGWYFCKNCGVRVVGVAGKWEHVDLDIEHWAGKTKVEDRSKLQKVWKTQGTTRTVQVDGKEETQPYHYLSVNAVTLEPGDEIDLRKWHENGWITYFGNGEQKGGSNEQTGEPWEGGMY